MTDTLAEFDAVFAECDAGAKARPSHAAMVPEWLPCGFLTVHFPFGDHRTFRIRFEQYGQNRGKRTLSLLIGPCNTDDYEQIGIVTPDGFDLRKSTLGTKTETHARLLWDLARGEQLDGYELLTEKRCRLCMRPLTDPESIHTELGPTCRKKLGI